MADVYIDLIKQRRTCYPLKAESSISDERIKHLAGEIIQSSPSSFNCQATRYLILLHADHVKFWQIAKDVFKATLSAEQYKAYEGKLDSHQAGYGTVLLFEDLDVIRDYQKKFARYVWHIQSFSEHNNAISTFNLWTVFCLEGFACNLQHVNPTVDQKVVEAWNVSDTWSLKAQLVFGAPAAPIGPAKPAVPPEERILCYGQK